MVLTEDEIVFPADCRIVVVEASVFEHPEIAMANPRDTGRKPTERKQLVWTIEDNDYRGIGYFVPIEVQFKSGDGFVGFHGIGGGSGMLGAMP